jgi:hypothetical protein
LEYKFESLEEFQVLKNTLGISLSGKMDVFLYLRDIHTEHGLEKSLSGIHLEVPFEHINSIHLEHKKIILDISNVWLLWVVVKVASDALILLWYPCFGSSCCGLCR